ncbi:hypothetical protein DAKH74_013880 [Maudiozyma humilis]|uniref:Reverse transcriptase domain-containing protein n=1 Tax=Maudiozyma humilis TaxID=51915 RepID=A0AAV5RVM8_MAUHU|nr:hypothetical protein DAKH74_013880 [Kazachstania humilis]
MFVVEVRRALQCTNTATHFGLPLETTSGKHLSDLLDLAMTALEENKDVIVDKFPTEPTPSKTIVHSIELIPGQVPLANYPIEPHISPFADPIILVKKKDGIKRMCCDYRGLNETTVRSKYSLPRIYNLSDMLSDATAFSQLDLVSEYHQVEINPEDQEKTAFVTPQGQLGDFILDDISICSKSMEEHQEPVQIVLELSCKAKLYAKKKKGYFVYEADSLLRLHN